MRRFVINIIIIFSALYVNAQTSGPKQPEFSSFSGVSSDGFVNEFDGSFNYTIDIFEVPGPDGISFPIVLSYTSGVKPEDEASWVGLGWTLNSGSIVRNLRGYPDDYNGDKVRFINKRKPIYSLAFSVAPTPELLSLDDDFKDLLLNYTLMYNTETGFHKRLNVGWASKIQKNLSLNLNYSIGSTGNEFGVNAYLDLSDELGNYEKNVGSLYKNKSYALNTPSNNLLSLGLSTSNNLSIGLSGYYVNSNSANLPSINLNQYTSVFTQGSYDVRFDAIPHIGAKLKLTGSIGIHRFEKENDYKVAYGYMYSGNAVGREDVLMDYYIEGQKPLKDKEKYLGIPFANSDQFVVMGAGLTGGFKLFHKNLGTFKPNRIASKLFNVKGGFSTGVGIFNFGIGYDLGGGYNQFTAIGHEFEDFSYPDFKKNEVLFRFNNDKAGSIQLTEDIHDIPNAKYFALKSDASFLNPILLSFSNLHLKINEPFDVNSSSNIKFNLVKEHKTGFSEYSSSNDYAIPVSSTQETNHFTNYYNANKNKDEREEESSSEGGEFEDRIRNFNITNKDGFNYDYGLPIYSRKERNHNFIVDNLDVDNLGLVYKDMDVDDNVYITGQEQNAPYASTYLLTSITAPNFIDRLNDGPTQDDIGGWVRFRYLKTTTNNNLYDSLESREGTQSFYKWRMPYYGLTYQMNSISDNDDNMASVLSGEKEIYFLDTIETKTHIAIFYKSIRYDSYQALPLSESELNSMNKEDIVSYIDTKRSYLTDSIRMLKLDSIQLYFKNNSSDPENWQLLKVANFEYDYSLSDNVINNIYEGEDFDNGKLTLKKVWIENYNTKEHLIKPYVFEYKYPTTTSKPYPTKYSSLQINSFTDAQQNPDYNYNNVDAWGNYAIDNISSQSRKLLQQSHVNQNPPSSFDPAAWHLKQIRMPSGGEVHVQYEQNEYSYVQDERAMIYVPIRDYEDIIVTDPYFYIRFNDVFPGGATTDEKDELVRLSKEKFLQKGELINYKLLWSLMSFSSGDASLNNCKSDYLDGYVKVESITQDANGIKFEIKRHTSLLSLPKVGCQEYVSSTKIGKIDLFNSCDPNESLNPSTEQFTQFLSSFLSIASSAMNVDKLIMCRDINLDGLSYLRLPTVRPKKGGGVRVKRVLFYDKFNEYWRESDPVLYGKEYIYKDKDGNNSGVATNEPNQIGDENALLKGKVTGSTLKYIITGNLKDQYTTPVSKSILSAPQVGYSSVITKNIHDGLSEVGFKISEYYTSKDYPFDYRYDNEHNGYYASKIDNDNVIISSPLIYLNYFYTYKNQAQNYRFIKNQMNGQKKREANYSGVFSNSDSWKVANYTEYEYFEPGTKIPIFNDYDDISFDHLGSETEVFIESKEVSDIGGFIKGNIDKSIAFLPFAFFPYPVVSYSGGVESMNSILSTSVVNKIVSHPTYLKKIINYKDGKQSIVENVAFDKNSGDVALRRYYDGHNDLDLEMGSDHLGAYHEYSFYGSNQYNFLNIKSKDENVVYKHKDLKSYRIIDGSDIHLLIDAKNKNPNECINLSMFGEGDVIRLTDGFMEFDNPDGLIGYYNISKVINNKIELIPLFEKDGFDFATTSKTTYPANIEIIEASESNRINEKVGMIVTYGEDTQDVNGFELPVMSYTETISPAMQDEIDEREEFVEAVNDFLYTAYYAGDSDLSTTYSGTMTIKDLEDNCMQITPNKLRAINVSGTKLQVCLENNESNSFSYSSTFHPLVEDLNNWLDRVWSTRLDREVNREIDWDKCNIESNTFGGYSSEQKFKNQVQMQGLTDYSLGETLRDLTGMTKLEETEYYIMGQYLKGNQIVKHLWMKNSWDFDRTYGIQQTFFAKRHSATDIEAYISSSMLQFTDELASITTVDYTEIFGISRQMDRYGRYCSPEIEEPTEIEFQNGAWKLSECRKFSDCANYNFHTSNYINLLNEMDPPDPGEIEKSDWFKGFIDLPTLSGYQVYDASSTVSSNIDAVNEQMWGDMGYGDFSGSSTITFTEDIGYFYINVSDGYLCYKRVSSWYDKNGNDTINSDDDELLGLDSIVKMFQIMPAGGYAIELGNECCFEFDVLDIDGVPSITYTGDIEFVYLDSKDGYKLKVNYNDAKRLANPCSDDNFCLSFCYDIYPLRTVPNVISASAATYTDEWDYELGDYNYEELNPSYSNDYKTGNKGKIKQSESFVYNTDIIQARGGSNERIYSEAGVYNNFDLYNWKNNNSNSENWLSQNIITKYSPNGNLIESKNILDIHTSVEFDANNHLVEIAANNAEENSYDFESFELYTAPTSSSISSQFAHSGKKSLWLQYNMKVRIGDKLIINSHIKNVGLKMFVWVKTDFDRSTLGNLNYSTNFIEFFYGDNSAIIFPNNNPISIVAKTGEWSLYTIELNTTQLTSYTIGSELYLGIKSTRPTNNVWIDDYKIQPLDASVNCYVYNLANYQLMTSFDDQHFGLYYNYNDEGQLIRKRIETERGMKTITEQQHNILGVKRGDDLDQIDNYIEDIPGMKFNREEYINKLGRINPNVKIGDVKENKSEFDLFKFELSKDTLLINYPKLNKEDFKVDSTNNKYEFTPRGVEKLKQLKQLKQEIQNGSIDSTLINNSKINQFKEIKLDSLGNSKEILIEELDKEKNKKREVKSNKTIKK